MYIEQSFKRLITHYIQYNRSEAEPSNNRKPVFIRKKLSHIQDRPTSRAHTSRRYLLDVCFILQPFLVKSRFWVQQCDETKPLGTVALYAPTALPAGEGQLRSNGRITPSRENRSAHSKS